MMTKVCSSATQMANDENSNRLYESRDGLV